MYCHLLVPIDSSPLSSENVQASVQLASKLGARITFFHATSDYSATGEGALLHAMDPGTFEQESTGVTNVVLLKAMTSARAAGVICAAVSRTSDHPAEAIVEAASEHGADLIVMASRGTRGLSHWLHSSQTQRVLRHASVALLVTRVEANEPLTACERALGIIHDEHRSIAVVIQSLRRIAALPHDLKAQDLNQIELLVGYLRDFPAKLHHPKEELHLHRCLLKRHPASQDLLSKLEAQHVGEGQLIDRVLTLLHDQISSDNSIEQQALRDALLVLVDAIGGHMSLEETSVFALARGHLVEEDWAEIATAFEANDDLRFGDFQSYEFDVMFKRIANLVMHSK